MSDTKKYMLFEFDDFFPGKWITICHENGEPLLFWNKEKTTSWPATCCILSKHNDYADQHAWLLDPNLDNICLEYSCRMQTVGNLDLPLKLKIWIRTEEEIKGIFRERYPKICERVASEIQFRS
jgi:hypothetical protein